MFIRLTTSNCLFQSSDCMLETCMLLAGVDKGPRALGTPVKAIRVGVGFIKTRDYNN